MKHYPENRLFDICLKCHHVSPFEKGKKIYSCQNCGFVINYEDLESAIKLSYKSVYFGYQYRNIYEKDFETDEDLKSRYYIEPLNEIYFLIATSIISGIVGNFAYDFVKKIVKAILNKEIIVVVKDKEIVEMLENEEEFRKFYDYINDYLNGMKNVKPIVREAIEDEIRVDSEMEEFETFIKTEKKVKNNSKNLKQKPRKKTKKKK